MFTLFTVQRHLCEQGSPLTPFDPVLRLFIVLRINCLYCCCSAVWGAALASFRYATPHLHREYHEEDHGVATRSAAQREPRPRGKREQSPLARGKLPPTPRTVRKSSGRTPRCGPVRVLRIRKQTISESEFLRSSNASHYICESDRVRAPKLQALGLRGGRSRFLFVSCLMYYLFVCLVIVLSSCVWPFPIPFVYVMIYYLFVCLVNLLSLCFWPFPIPTPSIGRANTVRSWARESSHDFWGTHRTLRLEKQQKSNNSPPTNLSKAMGLFPKSEEVWDTALTPPLIQRRGPAAIDIAHPGHSSATDSTCDMLSIICMISHYIIVCSSVLWVWLCVYIYIYIIHICISTYIYIYIYT